MSDETQALTLVEQATQILKRAAKHAPDLSSDFAEVLTALDDIADDLEDDENENS
ncbi:MAG: hypothetical protein ABIW83_07410 [Allosphingosinicella sp.]